MSEQLAPRQEFTQEELERRGRFKTAFLALKAEIADLAARQRQDRMDKIQKSPVRADQITALLRLHLLIRGRPMMYIWEKRCRCCKTVLDQRTVPVHRIKNKWVEENMIKYTEKFKLKEFF